MLLCLPMVGWLPHAAQAEINLRAQLTEEMTSSELTDKESGIVTSTDNNRFDQLYNIDLARQLYPHLSFRSGLTAQLNDGRTTSEGDTTKSSTEMLHPFIDVNLATPIFTTGLGYEKTQLTQTGTARSTTVDSQDQLHGLFLWEPVDLPRVNLNYTSSHRYNDADTTDQQQDDLALNLRYDWHDIYTNYSYINGKSENLITGLQGQRDSHDGRINLSRQLTKDLNMNCSYRANYSTETWFGAGTPYLTPLFVGGATGFYLLDDFSISIWDNRTDGAFLVDGVKSGSSPINLGTNGDEAKDVNFGLDFVVPAEISAVRVWVDRDASDVENFLTPRLYILEDNGNWQQQSNAQYVKDIDDYYFEFTLPSSKSTRYIRVETTPLSNAADPSNKFRDLYVTEIETFTLKQGDLTRSSLDNNLNLGLTWRLDPKTTTGYSIFYRSQKTEGDNTDMQRTTALSQTVNLNRTLNTIFNASVRASRDDRQTSSQESLDYTYGAALTATWLDTFRQALSYSGATSETIRTVNTNTESTETNKTNSLLLRNVAQLYEGWSANVDLGYSWIIPWDEGKRTSKTFRIGSSIIPNPKLTVNTTYTYSVSDSDQPTTNDERIELSVALSPTTAISLFSRYTVIDQSNADKKVYQEYSIDWSPFPDGTVQLFLGYHESLTNEGDDTKSSQAGFDWRVNNRTSVRTSFNMVKAESLTTITESQVFSVNLRISL
ncbi:MAG: hypothetical protein KKD73_00765 [Proteobacteria bacterium]|nr:hypothetical protein [Pseudomonadota bacterium]MBU1641011.1 hypothetical protein [Pseudomonadota bacterium]